MYQFSNLTAGSGGGAATLSLDSALHRPAIARGFGNRVRDFSPSQDLDLVTDLGVRIGSGTWWRGLATVGALCWAAVSFAPGFAPLAGTAEPFLPESQWDEARALSIAPLALGADTGRRMAPTEVVVPLTDTPERPRVDIVATFGRGDGFARMLERAGVGRGEASAIADLLDGRIAMDDLKAGTRVDMILGRRANRMVARPVESLAFRAAFDLKVEVVRDANGLQLRRIPIAVDDTPLRIQGFVGSSLYRAARAAGAPAKAVETYLRAIATQLSVGSIGASDRFDLIVEHRRAETGETETGRLLYAGLARSSGKDLQLLQWEQAGRTQWFEASGVGKQSGMLTRPVPGRVSSNFGMRRHPILGYSRMHKGMDFRAGHGTPILAAADGRVTRSGWAGGYGKQVRLVHDGGLMTSYSHMSRIAVSNGGRVRQGQVIGYVGSTGLSTGPHLHYELYRNGGAINPATVKFTTRAQLSGSELARFKSRLRGLLGVPIGARAEVKSADAATKTVATDS